MLLRRAVGGFARIQNQNTKFTLRTCVFHAYVTTSCGCGFPLADVLVSSFLKKNKVFIANMCSTPT